MSNSNPQLSEYIRERLMNMYLELQESNKERRAQTKALKKAHGVDQRPSSPRADAAFARTRAANTQLTGQNTTMTGQNTALTGQNTALTGQNTALTGQNTALTGQNAALTGQNAALTGKRVRSANRLKSARGEINTLTGQNTALTGQNTALTGQNTALTGDLAVRTGSERGARRALALAAADVTALAGEKTALTGQNTALAGENATLTGQNAALMAKPWEKWKAGVGKLDNSLLGSSPASGVGPPSKGLLGSGGNVGMGAKLAVGGVAAGLQGLSSASTEWEENKNKGMGSGENLAKTAVRGTAGAVGAGVGATVLGGLGQALGSRIPGIGGAIGFALGSAVGGLGGGYVADKAADFVTNVGDDDEGIKDFQADRKIRGIERQDKIDQAKQAIADRRLRKSGDTTLSPLSSGQQQQSFTVNGQAAGGNQYFPGGNVSITSTNSQSMRR